MKIALCALALAVVAPSAAVAGGDSAAGRFDRAADYASWRNRFFVRGGYAFHGHIAGVSGSISDPEGALGFDHTISLYGRSRILFETEAVYVRDSERIPGVISARAWSLSGLAGFRWQYDTRAGVSPFISGGIGPNYSHAKVNLVGIGSAADHSWAFGYSGRAGIEAFIAKRVSIEVAYRYLGATDKNATGGIHAAEAGINFNW
ncbi:MAG: outer membrane beta-barrel protein [Alphaproteobacteria bacterium]|nr:outer membrane beta-barrel protein [Alphaproteobacteria bacterium]